MTSIQQKQVYNGTRRSALEIILSRTFGNTLVQASLVLLCVLWTVPTAGLLISSVRAPNDINTSGWWQILTGGRAVNRNFSITVVQPDETVGPRNSVASGDVLTVSRENSALLNNITSGSPEASISRFSIPTTSGRMEVAAFGEPIEVQGVGTVTYLEDGSYEFTPVESFVGTFTADYSEAGELPLDVNFTLEGLTTTTEELVVEGVGIETTVPRTGRLIVNADGSIDFTPRADFVRSFEVEPIDPASIGDGPFTITYTLIRTGAGGNVITGTVGEETFIPGVGTILLEGNGAYTLEPLDTFAGELNINYAVTNPTVTADNYDFVINSDGMGDAFLNSLTVTIPATIIPIAIAAFAAYAFAWMTFPGRQVLFIIVVGLMVVPLQVAFIPLLRIYTDLGLNGSFLGLWLAHTGFGMPLAVFLLRNYIAGLPRELIESASIDGASHFTIFVRLVLPLSVPALASFAIFQFLWVWNDLLVALVFLGGTPVVTSRLAEMVGSRGQDWYVLTSGAFITIIVPLIVFFSLQRYFVRGLLAGSVKGG